MIQALDNNALQAMLALPVLGAALLLVLAAGSRGASGRRLASPVAVAVACLELLLAVLALWRVAAGADLYRASDWVRTGLGLDLALDGSVAAAGVCVGLAVLTLLWLAAAARKGPGAVTASCVCALVLEAALIGVLLSEDLLLLLLCTEIAWLAGFFLLAAGSDDRAVDGGRRFAGLNLLGGMMMLVGVLGLGCVHFAQTGFLSFAFHDVLELALTGRLGLLLTCGVMLGLLVRSLGPLTDWAARRRVPVSARLSKALLIAATILPAGFALWRVADRSGLLAGGEDAEMLHRPLAVVITTETSAATYLANPWAGPIFAAVALGLAAVGLLLCAGYLRRSGRPVRRAADLTGLYRTHPGATAAMTVCLLALLGAPGTAGFFARVLVVGPVIWNGVLTPAALLWAVTIVAAVMSLRPLAAACSFAPDAAPAEPMKGVAGQLWRVAITIVTVAVLILGVLPHLLLEPIMRALR